jgi:hypothetical protein
MTQAKLALATRLAELRGDGSNPEEIAKTMKVSKIHYEIEKIMEKKAAEPEPEFKPLIQSFFESFFGSDRE